MFVNTFHGISQLYRISSAQFHIAEYFAFNESCFFHFEPYGYFFRRRNPQLLERFSKSIRQP